MSLQILYRWFDRRCRSYEAKVNDLFQNRAHYTEWQFRFLSDALLSEVWQTWCLFSRILILKSVRGCKARDGNSITGRYGDNSWKRICYEASHSVRSRTITSSGHANFQMRYESTWGDIDIFIKVIQYFSPANQSALLTSYGLPFDGIKHMQKVRNSCAHKNIETILDLNSLNTIYDFSKVKCPSDVMWATKRGTNTLAIEQWLYEINLVADNATSSL